MTETSAQPPVGDASFEEWFLAGVGTDPMPVENLLGAVLQIHRAGATVQADSWAELMEETLTERGRADETTRVLRMRAGWHKDDAAFKAYCEKKLSLLYRSEPVRKKFVANAGFNRAVSVLECFRRMDTLQRLASGVLCTDKTWGFGVVKGVDAFYERVTIDFSRKPGHEMSLGYAAETLQFVSSDHLLARKHREGPALVELAKTDPAELVRVALRSFGPLTVQRLQDILQDGIVAPADWKPFWEAARKVLKNDPLILFPAKRSDPIQCLEKARSFDRAWFDALLADRTPEGVFARLDELAEDVQPDSLEESWRKAIGDRLAFLLRGFGDKDPAVRVRAVLNARTWQIPAGTLDIARELTSMLQKDAFLACASALPAKRLAEFIGLLVDHDRKTALEVLLPSLPVMTLTALNVAVDVLLNEGEEERCASIFRDLVGMRKAGVEVLYWLARRPEKMQAWSLGTLGDLAFQILAALEKPFSGERLKAANQLVDLVEQREWLEAAAAAMNDVQRTSFIRMLRNAMGRVPVDTQAMIGRLVMLHPELAAILEEKAETMAAAAPKGGMTSWRSYQQRQEQLQKLINEEIPRNSRDIAQARSYGDLRENFEYKTAKETQGILLRRRGEFEQSLNEVRGTDFSGCPTDAAGMGTRVVLRYPDERLQTVHILGEWDQDPALSIVSCASKMGKALAGRKAGESVGVPGEDGEVVCRIAEVGPLPEDILAWARGASSAS